MAAAPAMQAVKKMAKMAKKIVPLRFCLVPILRFIVREATRHLPRVMRAAGSAASGDVGKTQQIVSSGLISKANTILLLEKSQKTSSGALFSLLIAFRPSQISTS